MPALTQSYEVLLDFTNDMHDCATIQLLRDYGRNTSTAVLLQPGESITLVLDAGSMYKYALKSRSKVANVSARSWRDVHCDISQLFGGASSPRSPSPCASIPSTNYVNGVTVDRIWRDYRFNVWNDSASS
ncbi:hypothetical protein BKA82DRAFT_134492 [Pisolithus tinctorius]|uniref:Uncharacterized protein n=1 Tax=Pisolithus tinctorius Marx 270 TaxID=870435 RepID=A0A0C3KF36_PISTI|nr:hypothetical protein BKA82DRAFT_134492 [Pisolithus tinctorius]KIO08202.1 hypothetical protein M404DRAFT_134492 [Pisolithus tinctorius Marx 270]